MELCIKEKDGYIFFDNPPDFSLEKIFDCGQCFRFDKTSDGFFEGVAFGKYVRLFQDEKQVKIYGITKSEFEKTWKYFLALDEDYSKINSVILSHDEKDETIKSAYEKSKGIRILRQDGWEALVSFIISQNNNIPRIKKIIAAMCEKYGENIGGTHYAFPTPQALVNAGEDGLFGLKTGFRAKYIFDAAQKVSSGEIDLSSVGKMTTEQATAYLMQIKGVGLKVASCTLLFGFYKTDAFPIDVWVKRILEKYYPDGLDVKSFGNYAGIAQQYLFYYERYVNGK